LQFRHEKEQTRSTTWAPEADLKLSDARIGILTNVPDDWPAIGHLHLGGFTFARLRGAARRTEEWDAWFRRDTIYNPSPYQQLAAIYATTGDNDSADEIRYASRVREHEGQKGLNWLWSAFLRWVAGFGIGLYPFRVVYWILVISFLGGLYLWSAVERRQKAGHGAFWCWGAALARLLPIIEINKEFTDYFDEPGQREKLRGLPNIVFSAISVLGWFLAAILIAAVSGLTGKAS